MAETDPPPPRRRQKAGTASVDPIELALERAGPGVEDAAAALILKQRRLVEEQIEDLRLKKFTRWLVIGIVLLLLAATAAAAVQASRSNALIVEPLRVPPEMAQRGLTGEVIATRLLDRLARMQELSQSARAPSSYSDNWEDNLKVAVPQTGVSLGELWRLMRDWLGSDTRITGEVVSTSQGLVVTARSGANPGRSFAGTEAELDRLLDQAAEAIFRDTQPYRFSTYLSESGRRGEDEAVLRQLTSHPSPVERKWAFSGLSVNRREEGRYREAVAMADRALAIDPQMITAWANRASALGGLGHIEPMLQARRRLIAIMEQEWPDELDPVRGEGLERTSRLSLAQNTGDYLGLAHGNLEAALGMDPGERGSASERLASAFAGLHQPGRALLWLRQVDDPSAEPPAGPVLLQMRRNGIAIEAALEAGDHAGLRAAVGRLLTLSDLMIARSPPESRLRAVELQRRTLFPFAAAALARIGDSNVSPLAAQAPLDCYDCVLARGLAAEAAGDRREAERWYREAVRQAPSIPFAYDDWGRMLLQAGEIAAAIERFQQAHRSGPRWADPLKHWGDAMARQGRDSDAVRRYRQAADRAPRWGALHINWGQALWRLGRHGDARAHFRTAERLNLSPRDRGRLRRLWPIAFAASPGIR